MRKKVFGLPLSVLIVLVFVLLGVISTALLLADRNRVDREYRDVVACLDYNAMFELAEVSGKSMDSILADLRSIGYTSIAVAELTVLSAEDKGYLFEAPDELLISWAAENPKLKELLPGLLPRRNFCLLGGDRASAARARLSLLYGDNFLCVEVAPTKLPAPLPKGVPAPVYDPAGVTDASGAKDNDTWFLLSVPREAEYDFNELNLGFDPEEWRRARAAGFDVVPRLVNNHKYDAADLSAVFADLEAVSSLTALPTAPADTKCIIFEGDAVLGFPDNLSATASEIKKRGWIWSWIEFEIQDGADALASILAPSIVITHSISAEEMVQQTVPVAKSRFIRALKERNVRLIYIRPHFVGLAEPAAAGKGTKDVNAYEFNRAYFKNLMDAITGEGFRVMREPAAPYWYDLSLLKVLVALGVMAMFSLALAWVVKPPAWVAPAYWTLAIICSAGLYFVSQKALFSGWALVSAITAPLLAIAAAVAIIARGRESAPSPFARVLGAYFAAAAISAAGGMMIYALINSPLALVKVDVFHGVYLSLGLPVIFAAIYLWDVGSFAAGIGAPLPGLIARLNALLDRKIRFADMMVVFLGLAALAVILLRSGNDAPVGVGQMEQLFRSRLEDFLSVRPRTKEIFGYPAFFLFLAYFFRRKPPSIVLLLLGAVAFTSAVNTFCHLHTPIAISLTRSVLGILLGMISGSVLYLLYYVYLRILSWFKGRARKET